MPSRKKPDGPKFPPQHFACGTRARYVAGCRCTKCREANRDYYHKNVRDRIYGRNNPIVRATKTRNRLRKLSDIGVGTKTVHDLTGCSRTVLAGIASGKRSQCRKSTQDKVLAVPLQVWNDAQLVDAAPTWELLNDLLAQGWTKTALARELGSMAKTPALQIHKTRVTAKTAAAVKRLYRRIKEKERLAAARASVPSRGP